MTIGEIKRLLKSYPDNDNRELLTLDEDSNISFSLDHLMMEGDKFYLVIYRDYQYERKEK